jgi:hypothetical protein
MRNQLLVKSQGKSIFTLPAWQMFIRLRRILLPLVDAGLPSRRWISTALARKKLTGAVVARWGVMLDGCYSASIVQSLRKRTGM